MKQCSILNSLAVEVKRNRPGPIREVEALSCIHWVNKPEDSLLLSDALVNDWFVSEIIGDNRIRLNESLSMAQWTNDEARLRQKLAVDQLYFFFVGTICVLRVEFFR
mmetsp:Transcript_39162/g.81292  ORF Transcript_39162/g.81292 Transcript_39162/m.81292 type:complete len:107 (+) Transcript_39162:1-321(+)